MLVLARLRKLLPEVDMQTTTGLYAILCVGYTIHHLVFHFMRSTEVACLTRPLLCIPASTNWVADVVVQPQSAVPKPPLGSIALAFLMYACL